MPAEYDDSVETRRNLYEKTKAELLAKQMANSTSYDTAVLTLSSAFLGLSVTFIKDVVAPLSEANWLSVLFASWFMFCLAIISTVSSFIVGQAGYRALLDAAERYYIKMDSAAYQVSVAISRRIEFLNVLNGVAFIAGTVLMLGFVVSNFNRIAAMPTSKSPPPRIEHKGQPTVPFQQVPVAPPVQQTPPPAVSPTPAPVGGKSGA